MKFVEVVIAVLCIFACVCAAQTVVSPSTVSLSTLSSNSSTGDVWLNSGTNTSVMVLSGSEPAFGLIYVCRSLIDGEYVPGKYNPPFHACFSSSVALNGGAQYGNGSYQVLQDNGQYAWTTSGTATPVTIPANAVVGGTDRTNGTLYVCRGTESSLGWLDSGFTYAGLGSCAITVYTTAQITYLVPPPFDFLTYAVTPSTASPSTVSPSTVSPSTVAPSTVTPSTVSPSSACSSLSVSLSTSSGSNCILSNSSSFSIQVSNAVTDSSHFTATLLSSLITPGFGAVVNLNSSNVVDQTSSYYTSAAAVFDNDLSTVWDPSGLPAYFTVDLGAWLPITSIGVMVANDGAHTPYPLNIQISSTVSGPWTTVYALYPDFHTTNQFQYVALNNTNGIVSRYWKFQVSSTLQSFQPYIYELRFLSGALPSLFQPVPLPLSWAYPTPASFIVDSSASNTCCLATSSATATVDGDLTTLWNTASNTNNYLVFDMQTNVTVTEVDVWTEFDGAHTMASLQVATSTQKTGPWNVVYSSSSLNLQNVGLSGNPVVRGSFPLPSPSTSRYWRLFFASTTSEYQLYLNEVKFYSTLLNKPLPTAQLRDGEYQVSVTDPICGVMAQSHSIFIAETCPTTPIPSTLPPSTLPPSTLPPSTLPPSTLPPTTLPSTTLPPSTLPPTTLPRTTLPPSTLPPSTLPPSTLPPSTLSPSTTLPPSTLPPSTLPPSTTVSPTTSAGLVLQSYEFSFSFFDVIFTSTPFRVTSSRQHADALVPALAAMIGVEFEMVSGPTTSVTYSLCDVAGTCTISDELACSNTLSSVAACGSKLFIPLQQVNVMLLVNAGDQQFALSVYDQLIH